jgi:hypothetical protein
MMTMMGEREGGREGGREGEREGGGEGGREGGSEGGREGEREGGGEREWGRGYLMCFVLYIFCGFNHFFPSKLLFFFEEIIFSIDAKTPIYVEWRFVFSRKKEEKKTAPITKFP